MIIRIAAEPAVFEPSEYAAPHLTAAHDRLLELWREVGAVCRPMPEDTSRLPQGLRKRWEKALMKERSFVSDAHDRLRQSGTLEHVVAIEGIELACLSPARAASLRVFTEDRCSFRQAGRGVEVCSISECDQASVAKDARRLAREPIREGNTPEEIWSERFSGIITFCQLSATVVDRYCFKNRGIDFVLERLLQSLPRTANLDVYGAVEDADTGSSYRRVKKEFESRWLNRSGTITFFPRTGDAFKRVRHDRYIRIDRSVCSIGTAVEVFAGTRAWRYTTFQMVPVDEETRVHETRLRTAAPPPLV